MEIKISTEEATQIIEKYFKDKAYQLDGCLPVMFQEKGDGSYCFSVLIKFNLNDHLYF